MPAFGSATSSAGGVLRVGASPSPALISSAAAAASRAASSMPAFGSAASSSSLAVGGASHGVDRVAMTCVFDHVICLRVAQVPFLVVVGFSACSYSSNTMGWTLLASFRTHLWSLVFLIGP